MALSPYDVIIVGALDDFLTKVAPDRAKGAEIILIVDTSYSMYQYYEDAATFARSIINDLTPTFVNAVLYTAPNGIPVEKTTHDKAFLLTEKGRKRVFQMSGKIIIYVGDYEGVDTVTKLSQTNVVLWLCPGDCPDPPQQFRGYFSRWRTLDDIIISLRSL